MKGGGRSAAWRSQGRPTWGRLKSTVLRAGAVWLLQGINRVIEVGGPVFPDDKSPLTNCHIK